MRVPPRPLVMVAAAALLGAATLARADVTVGIDLSSTGPAAAIGIASKNAIQLWPDQIGGQKAHYIILDDGSDPGAAVRNVRKLISENKVDVVVGPNITPSALAMLDPVSEAETPMITLVGSASVVEPQDAKRQWAFKMAANDSAMADVMTRYMANHGVKNVAFIGFADAYGESWWREFSKFAELRKLHIVAQERFNRTDTSVTGQVLKLMAAKPDAVLIAGSGTPAALPQRTLIERGFGGKIYQTHGIATYDFIRVGGKDVEGTLFPTQPGVVAKLLPANHPARTAALAFTKKYEAKFGTDTVTQFAADAYGVWDLLNNAVPRAAKTAQPGTPAFRRALREALENTRDLPIPNGIMNTSPRDHVGLDQRASVMGQIKGGKFVYVAD
ncbi:branched-chain amino acid ABC transporter substrate-binding protein [Pandoraea terrae]|uniref:Branched-chain amino acid ABC transporter substrate-binding protein n=1 Tax=Pandoraea terrae TaxID=1537710 RepID=A0A5E4RFC3_9BURK|nr:ABC transporter substrate-binding protein [Pandoraea terrae]VVD62020.1 branched-chain amino acid ABC transporter substrate-binding protein [Pandoraea terrae]